MGKEDKDIEDLLTARANILGRPNEMNGRYKAGNFGLDFWDEERLPEPLERIIQRADLADQLIAEAESHGQDVDNPMVLKELAAKVNKTVGRSSLQGSWHSLRVKIGNVIKFITKGDDSE